MGFSSHDDSLLLATLHDTQITGRFKIRGDPYPSDFFFEIVFFSNVRSTNISGIQKILGWSLRDSCTPSIILHFSVESGNAPRQVWSRRVLKRSRARGSRRLSKWVYRWVRISCRGGFVPVKMVTFASYRQATLGDFNHPLSYRSQELNFRELPHKPYIAWSPEIESLSYVYLCQNVWPWMTLSEI